MSKIFLLFDYVLDWLLGYMPSDSSSGKLHMTDLEVNNA